MLTITLPPQIEQRLKSEASRLGINAADYATKLIESSLRPISAPQPGTDALSKWEAINETEDPEEIARRQSEFEEFKAGMNQNRLDAGGAGARKVHP